MGIDLTPGGGSEGFYEDSMKHVFSLSNKYDMPIVGFLSEHEMQFSVRGGYRMICQLADLPTLGLGCR